MTFIVIGLLTASIIEALRKMVDELTQRTDQLITTRAELTEAKQHRALLLADINHRIKNHLASVAGTLAMDRHRVEDEKAKQALDAAISRLSVLGRVYTRLHLSGANVEIDGQAFLQELCTDLSSTVIGLRPVSLSCTLYAINVDAQEAVTLGLVVNELVTNSVKYAELTSETAVAMLACSMLSRVQAPSFASSGEDQQVSAICTGKTAFNIMAMKPKLPSSGAGRAGAGDSSTTQTCPSRHVREIGAASACQSGIWLRDRHWK